MTDDGDGSSLDFDALLNEARRLNAMGDPRDALAVAERVLQACGPANTRWTAEAYECQTRSHVYLLHLEEALISAVRARDSWQQLGDAAGETRAHCALSFTLLQMGELHEALEAAYGALKRAETLGQTVTLIKALNAVGTVCPRLPGQHETAFAHLERGARLAKTLEEPDLLLATLGNQAAAFGHHADQLRDIGQPQAARHWDRQSLAAQQQMLATARTWQRRTSIHSALSSIGYSATMAGEYAIAEEALAEYFALLRQTGEPDTSSIGLLNLGILRMAQGRHAEARTALEQSLRGAEESKLPEVTMRCHKRLAEACEHAGDVAAALVYIKRYLVLREQSINETAERRARALAVLHETEKAKAQAEAERLRAEALARSNVELSRKARRLSRDVNTDALTGLANRRRLDAALEEGLRRPDSRLAIALIDIDHFKRVNDDFSHLIGDEVLRHMGRLLRAGCRRSDLAARYGGEEFAILFVDMDNAAVQAATERLREAVQDADWDSIHPGLAVTVSIGIASGSESRDTAGLLTLADERLYAAKSHGRNRVVSQIIRVA
jgi:diguanylate cyclase (GGDEF)-like protein